MIIMLNDYFKKSTTVPQIILTYSKLSITAPNSFNVNSTFQILNIYTKIKIERNPILTLREMTSFI